LFACAAFGLVALAWLVALVLFTSRINGGLLAAPEVVYVWPLAVLLVSLAAAARRMWRLARRENSRAEKIAVDWAALPAMVLAAFSVALPGGSEASIAGFAAIVCLAEGWALAGYAQTLRGALQKLARGAPPKSDLSPRTLLDPSPSAGTNAAIAASDQIRIDPPQSPAPHFPTADIAQQLVRRLDAEGGDIVQGWVRAAFEPQQRTASAHVAFCPSLEGELSIEFQQVEGRAARVKAAQLLAYGVRFDVKLADPAARAESVLIEFTVRGGAATGEV
jgi:hypothetical protein